MKKLAFLLIFLSLTRVGVSYAAESVANINGSFFFGTSSNNAGDVVNGVLALLIGPEGKPGLLGPEGKSAYELAKQKGFTGTFDEFLGSIVDMPSLISDDKPNDLKLGSDNKLLSQPTDTDYLAYYILAKG